MFCRICVIMNLLAFVLAMALPVAAEETEFTVTMRANYDFNILGGTSLNPGVATGYLPFEAVGDVTFEVDASINDPTVDSVPILRFQGELQGRSPSPMNLLPHYITPNVMFHGGNLTNVVRDPTTGEVLSAEVDDLQAQWKMVGLPGSDIDGLDLVTGGNAFDPNSNLPFFGQISAIPFAVGDVIKGPDVIDPSLALSCDGAITRCADEAFEVSLGNELVVLGRARTLTVIVPEPASCSLTALLVAGLALGLRRCAPAVAR